MKFMAMKNKITLLFAIVLCAGCSNSDDSSKINAVSQKLDMVLQNQTVIIAKLDAMPKTISDVGFYYSTNEISAMYAIAFHYHTNALSAMAGQEESIENIVNAETRRVGVIMGSVLI